MARAGRSVAELADVIGGRVNDGSGVAAIQVDDVTHDSRQAKPGTLFVAIRGGTVDGHDHVSGAVDLGASAVCVETPMSSDVPEIIVDDTRAALGPLADAVHLHPSASLDVVGVTGTNGKTTVTHYLESIASHAGKKTGLIGTIATRIGERSVESIHTTPEASDFQRLLAEMRDEGVEVVAAEVSSHALALGRVSATKFSVAAFTNLSQDHLDFHGDMDSYREVKRRLFTDFEVGTAVINIDDETGRLFADESRRSVLRVGIGGDVSFSEARPAGTGTLFRLDTPWGSTELAAPVVGSFNLANAVLAATCALGLGMGFHEVVAGLEQLDVVPGRFEMVSGDAPIRVVVDYAHTPAGVSAAIAAARRLGGGRVIALIGAGGDRDSTKRPLMGQAVSAADIAVVTSDNPRSEDPDEIVRSVRGGVVAGTELVVEVDRRKAISTALELAEDTDIVLILGRGHEPYQQIGEERLPFDDRVVARDALERRRSANSGSDSGSMAL